MLRKLTDLAKSEKGKEFAEKATAKAKQIANDPETREKFEAVKKKVTDKVGGGDDKPSAPAPAPGPGPAPAPAPAPGPGKPAGFGKDAAGFGKDDGPVATSSTGAPIDPDTAPEPIKPDHDPTPKPSGDAA